ncbi:MAG: RluA family pseudouridine synthase [Gemmiger sp.]|nr:RluA family pseudouridine synthase [Gemmiger sp.]
MLLLTYPVAAADAGTRLGIFLRRQGLTAGFIKAVKYHGNGFFLDGRPAYTDALVQPGQTVTLALPPEKQTDVIPQPVPFTICYQDDFTAVLDKPAGIAVHPTLNYPDHTLANGWLYYLASQGETGVFRPVNRIDKNTSGLVLCAKNSFAAPALAASAHKRYVAIAEGALPLGPGEVNAPLGRQGDSIIGRCVCPDGKPSLTRYRVLGATPTASLLLCETVTGRTHQIRVHLAHIGHPLAGDTLYGGHVNAIARHALHCAAIRFAHPLTGAQTTVTAPLPGDMVALCAAWGLVPPGKIEF